jgi:hypothetical protein
MAKRGHHIFSKSKKRKKKYLSPEEIQAKLLRLRQVRHRGK